MSVKHALLGLLSGTPMHGYDLKRAFDDRLGDLWSLNVGQIYSTLDRLLVDGLVAFDAIEQQDKPDKKVYHITPAGLEELRDWRTRPIKPEPRALRDELFVKLMFIEDAEIEDMIRLVQAQQSVYLAQMMQLTNRKFELEQQTRRAVRAAVTDQEKRRAERDRFMHALLIDVALLHAEADIRWLRQCEARLKDLGGQE